jgi:hypothetical protein
VIFWNLWRYLEKSIRYASLSSSVIAMYEAHNPLDVDIGALKKGEVDLGTSM